MKDEGRETEDEGASMRPEETLLANAAAPRARLWPRAPSSGAIVLTLVQEQFWFLDALNPGDPAYNSPHALRLTGPLDLSALVQALNEVVARHAVLRTRYEQRGGELVGIVMPAEPFDLPLTDLQAL